MKKERSLKIIIWLSVLGILISLYLVQNHYAPPGQGALCDLGETLSCSLVNTSVFSELFSVPVAVFGAVWFLFMIWMASKKDKAKYKIMFWWSLVGTGFIVYMVIAEFILKAICPFCTLVHIIVLILLYLSYNLYKIEEKPHHRDLSKAIKRWVSWIIFINLMILLVFNFLTGDKAGDHDEAAQCFTDAGVKMYSSFRCGVCARTKSMFASSFKYIDEIECHPQGPNSQWQRCQEKAITGTPTWILEEEGREVKRNVGFMSIEELKKFTGCE